MAPAVQKARRIVKSRAKSTPISKMSTEDLDAMVAEFDREFIADTFGPMTQAAKERHQRARKKKRGRPRVGSGTKMISVTVEKTLLKRVDRLAKRLGMSRAKLIAVGLWRVVKAADR